MQKKKSIEKRNITLTLREQEIFLVLYTSENPSNSRQISRKLGLPEESTKNYIDNIISKGVPVIKRYVNGEILYVLDAEFKNLQAKENILSINEAIAKQFS